MDINNLRRINARLLAGKTKPVSSLAEKVGKSQGQISHLIGKNPTKNIGYKIAREIEEAYGKEKGWLDEDHSLNVPGKDITWLPLIEWEHIRQYTTSKSYRDNYKTPRHYPSTLIKSQNSYALRLNTDSMQTQGNTSFPENAVIAVDAEAPAGNGSFVIALAGNLGKPVFRKLVEDGEIVYLKPLNPQYPVQEIKKRQRLNIFGVVRQLIIDLDY